MSQHEPPLLLGQVSIGIDINLPHLNGNRGNGNVHPLCYKRVFHQPEAGGYAPQKRIAGQEPFLCPLDGAAYPALPRLCPDASGIVHGGPQSLPQAVRKNLPPVRGASPPAPGRPPPGHVRPSAAHGGKMQAGRVIMLFQPIVQLLLLPGPRRQGKVQFPGNRTDMKICQISGDHTVTGGIPEKILLPVFPDVPQA